MTESYAKPAVWYSHMDTYLGQWTKEKHIFLAQHTGNDQFYATLYDSNLGMHLFDAILALNVSAVNALLAQEPAEPIVADLPILKEGIALDKCLSPLLRNRTWLIKYYFFYL